MSSSKVVVIFGLASVHCLLSQPLDSQERAKNPVLPTERSIPSTAAEYAKSGEIHFKKARWDEAIRDFGEAIRLDPKHVDAYACRGLCQAAKGDLDLAIKDFDEAIRLNPTNATFYLNRGNLYRTKRDLDRALEDLSECLRINPTDDIAYKSRASIYNNRNQFDFAIADCTAGLRLKTNDANALAVRGYAYRRKGEYQNAIGDYSEAMRVNPKDYNAYVGLGWLRATCPNQAFRNGEEAVKLATQSCRLTDWKNRDCVDALAAAYAEMGNFEKAVRCEQQAIAMSGFGTTDQDDMVRRLELFERKQVYREVADVKRAVPTNDTNRHRE